MRPLSLIAAVAIALGAGAASAAHYRGHVQYGYDAYGYGAYDYGAYGAYGSMRPYKRCRLARHERAEEAIQDDSSSRTRACAAEQAGHSRNEEAGAVSAASFACGLVFSPGGDQARKLPFPRPEPSAVRPHAGVRPIRRSTAGKP
jgi:hypothetical protein